MSSRRTCRWRSTAACFTSHLVRVIARSTDPAIALSGYGSEGDKSRSTAAGFSAHLTKPVTIERLSETIRRLVPFA